MGIFTTGYIDIVLLISFVINIILLAVNIYLRQSNEEKDVRLIQFYLDLKFVHQQIAEFNFLGNQQKFASQLKRNMQDYYNLEDILILDSVRMAKAEKNNHLRASLIKFLQSDIDSLMDRLSQEEYVVRPVRVAGAKIRIYVFKLLNDNSSDGLIVCCEKAPSLLGTEERKSLKNVVNLLRATLVSS